MTYAETMYALIALIVLWTIPWKGAALWRAAKNGQKVWFIVFLFINTLAILEIIYIFFLSKEKENQ
jgi:hypothetical protein